MIKKAVETCKNFFFKIKNFFTRQPKKRILQFLKRQKAIIRFFREKGLHQQPLFILLGIKSSGKTTLLLNSETKFIFEKKVQSIDQVTATWDVDWYVSKKTTYLEIAGFSEKPQKGVENLLHIFYRFFKKRGYGKRLQGVIFVLSIQDLHSMVNDKSRGYLRYVQQQLHALTVVTNKTIPFYVVLNKCDAITGFQEFFNDLSKEERWQPWGVSLDKTVKRGVRDSFYKEFDQLCARLHQWLTWRMQHENYTESKVLINHFPLRFSQLRSTIARFITETAIEPFLLKGIFFTSAIQTSIPPPQDSRLGFTLSENHFLTNIRQSPCRSFFIHDLLDSVFFNLSRTSQRKRLLGHHHSLIYYSGKVLMIGLIFLIVTYYVVGFKKQIQLLNKTQQSITVYQSALQNKQVNEMSFQDKLAALQSLQDIMKTLDRRAIPLASVIGPQKKINNLQVKASKTYYQMLQDLLLPMVLQDFTLCLTSNTTSSEVLYKALKAYVMLENRANYQLPFFFSALKLIWRVQSIERQRSTLLPYLKDIFKYYSFSAPLDQQAIDVARKRLTQMNPSELSYLIFDNLISNGQLLSLNLNQNKQAANIFSFRIPAVYIPSQYTAQVSMETLNEAAIQAAQEAVKGNWIIGMNRASSSPQEGEINTLRQSLLRRYYEESARVWMEYLNNIKIIDFQNLSALNQALLALTNPQDPLLWQLFNLINSNLKPEIINTHVQLSEFIHVLDRNDRYTVLTATNALKDLQGYLAHLANSDQTGSHAFEAAIYRLRNHGYDDPITHLRELAQNYPEPMKSWLYDISMQAWRLLLMQTQNYINQQWQEAIIPQYRAQLMNRFPFSSVATNDVSLESFSYFFAPTGLLDNFISKYLKPFLDTSQVSWKVKTLDGQGLALSSSLLSVLQSVNQIEQLFFEEKGLRVFLPFSIQVVNFEDNVHSLMVQLGEQQATFQKKAQTFDFKWPYENVKSDGGDQAKIIFEGNRRNQTELQSSGVWGWFRLLRSTNITKDSDQQTYQIIVDKEGLSAHVEMAIQKPNSPFSLTKLFDWRLPESLFGSS